MYGLLVLALLLAVVLGVGFTVMFFVDLGRGRSVVVPLSGQSMLFAFLVAGGAWYATETTVDSSCSQTFSPGANIDHAWKLVLFAALGGLALIGFVRKEKRLLIALLLFEAAALSIA